MDNVENMDNEELNTALYQKIFAEQEKFRDELCLMAGEEVLRHAYEYVIREDILLAFEYNDLSDNQCKALLSQERPLATIFGYYANREDDHMDHVIDVINLYARVLARDAGNTQN